MLKAFMMRREHRGILSSFARIRVYASANWLTIFFVICLLAPHLNAQSGTAGSFSGNVQDSSGAIIPGVSVTATHLATATSQTATTDQRGRYQIPLLPPGDYRVEVTHPGFKARLVNGVVLTVGKVQEIDFTLEIGDIAETVTVEGGAALVETRSSSVSSLVSSKEVSDLPLNGRSFDQLILLSVGTTIFNERNVNGFRGLNNFYSVSGTRPASTSIMVDGVEYTGGGGVTTNVNTSSGKMLGVDGIQEFAVVTNSGDASYGKRAGGQVNVVTRSGTNEFHGGLFEFLRNDVLDAKNFFDRTRPPLRRNNYGFSVGGPIVRDRTFFYTNYERLQESRGSTSVFNVPDMNIRRGIFPNGTVLTVNPASQPILDFYPVPNRRNFGNGFAEASVPAFLKIADTFGLARMDHHFSDADTLFVRYLIQSGQRDDTSAGAGLFNDIIPARVQLATIGHTRIISSSLLNQISASFNRGYSLTDNVPLPGITVPAAFFLVPGEPRPGRIQLTQGVTLGLGNAAGAAGRYIARNVYQVSDQLNYTTGQHGLQTGFGYQRIQSNEFQGSVARGDLTFGSLTELVEGRPRLLGGPLPGSDGFKSFRQSYYSLYLQDSIRLTRTFTLNAGLRFEFMTNPREEHNRIANWVPENNQLTGRYPDQPPVIDRLFTRNPSGNFAPRIGFAWDVFGSGRTSVRAGFGLYHSQIENEFRGDNAAGAPYWRRVNVTNPPFPNPGPSLAAEGLRLAYGIDREAKLPTVVQYNFRVEQTIGAQTVLAAAYAGSHGSHLVRQSMPQTLPPFVNTAGRLEVSQVLNNPSIDRNARFQTWDGNSTYNSLQVEVTKSVSRGLRFKNSFTWSKTIDDGVQPVSMPSGLSQTATITADHKFDRGLAPYHVARQLVSNWTYDLPSPYSSGLAGRLFEGWQLGGILTASGGHPFTVGYGFARYTATQVAAARVDLAPNSSNNPILGGPDKYFDPTAFLLPPLFVYGNLGNATLIGPGLVTLDWSVSKNTSLSERIGLLFRAEIFNLLNRPNFAIPSNGVFNNANGAYNASAGVVQSTTTNAREIQFGLKLTF